MRSYSKRSISVCTFLQWFWGLQWILGERLFGLRLFNWIGDCSGTANMIAEKRMTLKVMTLKVLTLFVILSMSFVMSGTMSVAFSQQTVFIDYASFEDRLDEATSSAGVANFDPTEVKDIQENILSILQTAFDGFDIDFTDAAPAGDFATLNFGLSTTSGAFGIADAIDFRNQDLNDTARVFTGNFGLFIESSDDRSVQISELSTSLAGTAAHELGHNLGVEHRDCYGIVGLGTADSGGGHASFGAQNAFVMATGLTGLSETQRETVRLFSDLSLAKFEFGDQLVANPLSTIEEQLTDHSTTATAQAIEYQALSGPTQFDLAAAIEGEITTGELDYFSFDMLAGELATIQVISDVMFDDSIDATLRLFDLDGTTELIFNDDTYVSSSAINQGGFGYSLDSSIYNFQASESGTYFLELGTYSAGDLGSYELFFSKTSLSAVPEPGSALVLSALAMTLLVRRRR